MAKPRTTKTPSGPAPPAWERVPIPDEWTAVDEPHATSYSSGYLAGWESPKARCPLRDGYPAVATRHRAWEAGKKAGVLARQEAQTRDAQRRAGVMGLDL